MAYIHNVSQKITDFDIRSQYLQMLADFRYSFIINSAGFRKIQQGFCYLFAAEFNSSLQEFRKPIKISLKVMKKSNQSKHIHITPYVATESDLYSECRVEFFFDSQCTT